MLAIVFALEKWHQFAYGRHVLVNTDHKPLEAFSKKPLDRAPKRPQGMLLRILAYDIDVQYTRTFTVPCRYDEQIIHPSRQSSDLQ